MESGRRWGRQVKEKRKDLIGGKRRRRGEAGSVMAFQFEKEQEPKEKEVT